MEIRLKAAIIGCGNIAGGYDETIANDGVWSHAKAYLRNGKFELISAFDPDSARLAEFCGRWNVAGAATSAADIFDRYQPDVISICSPNPTHFPLLMEAFGCASVKAIFCEKPLTLSIAEARKVMDLSAVKAIPVLVNYVRRWDPLIAKTGRELKEGKFGTVLSGRVLYTKGVFHNASHAINLLINWLGPVTAYQLDRVIEDSGDDLGANFTLDFVRGPRITFSFLDFRPFNTFEIELFTTEGRLRLPGGVAVEWQARKLSPMVKGEYSLAEAFSQSPSNALAMEKVVEHLYSLAVGRDLEASLPDAVTTVEICENIRSLAKEKK